MPSSTANKDKGSNVPDGASNDESNNSINGDFITIGGTLIVSLIASRILVSISRVATAFAAPLAGLYLMSTCPVDESFDAKRELKRVLRGEKLPADHPDKPKNLLEKAMAKVSASIQAETDALVGCQVEIVDIVGCVKVVSIKSQTQNKYYYWLGAVHKWRYICGRDIPLEYTKKD